jgi:hypothetical protein
MASEQPKEVPADPAIPSSSTPAAGDDSAAPSKKGAKKAEAKAKKEAEKARKAAERDALAASSSTAVAEDLATDNYGEISKDRPINVEIVHLRDLAEEHLGKTIKLRAWIQNARAQGAKMAFVELREEGNWTVQGVVSASAEGKPVSRQMVKWIQGLKLESFVSVEALVQKPLEPVKSTKVSILWHLRLRCWVWAWQLQTDRWGVWMMRLLVKLLRVCICWSCRVSHC